MTGTWRTQRLAACLAFARASVTEALEQIQAHGGTVDAPRFEVPGVVVLGLFTDPAGNPMGVVELENGEVKILPPKETVSARAKI